MSDMNRLHITGYVGKDAELRYIPSGQAVANFTVASKKTWKDQKTGERKERTTWVKVTAWGKLAEIIGQNVMKGMYVAAIGEASVDAYMSKDGKAAATLNVTVQGFDDVKWFRIAKNTDGEIDHDAYGRGDNNYGVGEIDNFADIPF